MKALAIFTLAIFCVTCNLKEQKTDCSAYLVDMTDTLHASLHLDTTKIFKTLVVTSGDYLAGATVILAPVTGFRYNAQHRISLDAVGSFEINEMARRAEVEAYKQNLSRALDTIKSLPIGRTESDVFFSIFNSINQLSACECTNRTVYVLSDLRQHTTGFDTYSDTGFKLLQNTGIFYKTLDSLYPLSPNSTTVQVVFVHISANQREDNAFHYISTALINYLQLKGISARISSDF